ncbi:MAG: hypothetical protein CMD33_04125 [Flavobacteriales bacterium]|nr:hypothetical protein [Flavobacteriales bacterium]
MSEILQWISQPWCWNAIGPVIALMFPACSTLLNRTFDVGSSLSTWQSLLFINEGGIPVGFGTRCAEGCTSRHALVNSALAMAPVSIWLIRKSGRKRNKGDLIGINGNAPNHLTTCIGVSILGLGHDWYVNRSCPRLDWERNDRPPHLHGHGHLWGASLRYNGLEKALLTC